MPAPPEHAEARYHQCGSTSAMITDAIHLDLRRPRLRGLSRVTSAFASGLRSLLPAQRFLYERDKVPLPPSELRAAGSLFRSDRAFLRFAIADARMIERH